MIRAWSRVQRILEARMSIWRRAAVLLGVGALLSMMVGGFLPAAAGPRTGEHQTFTYTIPGDAVFPEGSRSTGGPASSTWEAPPTARSSVGAWGGRRWRC